MNKLIFLASAALLLVAPAFQYAAVNAYGQQQTVVPSDKAKIDEDTSRNVKDAIAADRSLAPFANDIVIKTDKGTVTLSGKVSSAKAKSDIETKAKNVPGVTRVINNIELK